MIETRAWKKIGGLIVEDMCRLCGEQRETVQHPLSGCKKLAGADYLRRHDNTLRVLAVTWASESGLLPENVKWYREKWERGQVLENNGKKLFWDWEHRMRNSCTARGPDLTLEDTEKKMILLVDMACPNEKNKDEKREEKMCKYQQLCFELREHRQGYSVEFVPVIIRCLGGGIKQLENDVRKIFENEKQITPSVREMQKKVL